MPCVCRSSRAAPRRRSRGTGQPVLGARLWVGRTDQSSSSSTADRSSSRRWTQWTQLVDQKLEAEVNLQRTSAYWLEKRGALLDELAAVRAAHELLPPKADAEARVAEPRGD